MHTIGEREVSDGVSIEAAFVASAATVSLAVPLAHALASIGRAALGVAHASPSVLLTWLTLSLGALLFCAQVTVGRHRTRWFGAVAFVPGAAALLATIHPDAPASAVALLVVGWLHVAAGTAAATWLEPRVRGVLQRRRAVSLGWAALGLVLVVQSARLGTFMADASVDWWLTTRDPLWAGHMCMPAYIEAADLQRQGVENVYDARFYSVFTRDAKPPLTVRNMDAWAGDPYQYPPQFLLLPRIALALTNDFLVLRTVWYALQLLGFVVVALAICASVGGRTGQVAALLIPVIWLSVPGMQSLQYGQFQMAALSCALAAMLAFDRNRNALGGALLSFAVFAKIFPGILVLWLLVQRRWRALAWTGAFAVLFSVVAVAVLGLHPFEAFVSYQVPRLADGRAFDFARESPEVRVPFTANNLSAAAVVDKLHELGVGGMTKTAGLTALRLYTLLLLLFTLFAARRQAASHDRRFVVWLALLNLAALQSYGAWGDYVTLGSVWLLTLWVPSHVAAGGPRGLRLLPVGACWLLFVVVPGATPIPVFLPAPVAMVLTTLTAIAVVAFNVHAAVRAPTDEAVGFEPLPRAVRT